MIEIARQRLAQQRLSQNPFSSPDQAIAWLGAMQAQEYAGGKWALGLRLQGTSDAALDRAFDAGAILRTHVLRPTWHFVTPADIGWMLELTAPRVKLRSAPYYRNKELDAGLLQRSDAILARALEGQRYLTRTELGQSLAQAGIQASLMRLTLMVMHAELEGLICSGPRRGKQFTYALLSERAPQMGRCSREQALAELARRYFRSHGPATLKDFIWWSGLTLADARAGVEEAGSALDHAEIGGQVYWFDAALPPAPAPGAEIFLLPTYDEFLVGYAGFGRSRAGENDEQPASAFNATLVNAAGQVLGAWRRTLEKKAVRVTFQPFQPFSAEEQAAAAQAARRYGEYLGVEAKIDE